MVALLAYAITHSLPSSWICDNTAPMPVSLASVSSKNGMDQLERAKTGAEVSFYFKVLKAWSLS